MKVILRRPGVLACGQYKAGIEYEVSDEEGARLVKVKGFEAVSSAGKLPPAGKAKEGEGN